MCVCVCNVHLLNASLSISAYLDTLARTAAQLNSIQFSLVAKAVFMCIPCKKGQWTVLHMRSKYIPAQLLINLL